MELITIRNRCLHFRGLSTGTSIRCRQEEHRSRRATAQGFDRGVRALPFAGARLTINSPNGVLSFIPLLRFLAFLLYTVRRVERSRL